MYIVRDVFDVKPGKIKKLVSIFKDTRPHFTELGINNMRILTDSVADYWTMIAEFEVGDLNPYFDFLEGRKQSEEIGKIMMGYMELVNGGHREILKTCPLRMQGVED